MIVSGYYRMCQLERLWFVEVVFEADIIRTWACSNINYYYYYYLLVMLNSSWIFKIFFVIRYLTLHVL